MASASPLIPISSIAHRYYLYDLEHVKQCREHHNILGVFAGTLPQHHQQNVFLGLPLELMAEEARLLVELGIAYIVDDLEMHTTILRSVKLEDRQRYMRALRKHGRELARADLKRAEDNTRRAMENMPPEQRERVQAKLNSSRKGVNKPASMTSSAAEAEDEDDSLFSIYAQSQSPSMQSISSRTSIDPISAFDDHAIQPKLITPTTSHPPLPLPTPPSSPDGLEVLPQTRAEDAFSPFSLTRAPATPLAPSSIELPPVPSLSSYALYKHLHSKSYFQSPGLRFGCQFCVYPGDPLRFHSHFLARGYDWDEEIDLLSLVGGGRLGTGVKKGYLIGGPVEQGTISEPSDRPDAEVEEVRTFCIEWAGM